MTVNAMSETTYKLAIRISYFTSSEQVSLKRYLHLFPELDTINRPFACIERISDHQIDT